MMKKEKVDRIERVFRETFLADSAMPAVPPQWRRATMDEIRMAAASGQNGGAYWLSLRQERILWRSAWAALAVVILIFTTYFTFNSDLWDADFASFAIVDMEGY